MNLPSPRSLTLAVSTTLLAACGGSGDTNAARAPATGAPKAAATTVDANALAAEIADTLQACSYDGAPVKVNAGAAGGEPPADCRDMVATIMNHTGLPQNFDVIEADVPNAAAVILLDDQKLPHRVIAFNRGFIDQVRSATQDNRWAPVSIMAHEIGHHLSGHTIMPGGSQPPTELEADKFSGFVLYKMGASLDDSLKAMVSLVPDGPDGPTHPGRGRRVTAISEGWRQACQQTGGTSCAAGTTVASRTPLQSPVDPAQPVPSAAPVAPAAAPVAATVAAAVPNTATVAATSTRDVLPAPGSTPSKFNRFVYDAFGVLSRDGRERVQQAMFEHARTTGVEVVTLLVDDLHGMKAEDYAYAMMRQLRVGKLDVGNGAVIVVAPNQNDAAIAMGPGVMLENAYALKSDLQRLRNFLDMGWSWCRKKGDCGGWTENFFGASEHVAAGTRHWEWTIRYPDLQSMLDTYQRTFQARMKSGERYEPSKDPTWRKLARVTGTIVDLTPPKGDKKRFISDIHERRVGPAMLVHADNGREVMAYMNPRTAALMPSGALREGATDSFVVRESNLALDTPQFDVLSYDLR